MPKVNSYNSMPKHQKSTISLYPLYSITSGATYSGVPTNEFVFFPFSNILLIEKSDRAQLPISSNTTFSGFKSLCMIPYSCKYFKPKII